jgi:hypothetical protein
VKASQQRRQDINHDETPEAKEKRQAEKDYNDLLISTGLWGGGAAIGALLDKGDRFRGFGRGLAIGGLTDIARRLTYDKYIKLG